MTSRQIAWFVSLFFVVCFATTAWLVLVEAPRQGRVIVHLN